MGTSKLMFRLLLQLVWIGPALADEINSGQDLQAQIGQTVTLKGAPAISQWAPQGTAKLITSAAEVRMDQSWPADILDYHPPARPIEVTVRGVLRDDQGFKRFPSSFVLEDFKILEVKEHPDAAKPATVIHQSEDLQANVGKSVIVEGEPCFNGRRAELITEYGRFRYPCYWDSSVYDRKAPRKVRLKVRAKLIYEPEEVIKAVPGEVSSLHGEVGERVPAGYLLGSPELLELTEKPWNQDSVTPFAGVPFGTIFSVKGRFVEKPKNVKTAYYAHEFLFRVEAVNGKPLDKAPDLRYGSAEGFTPAKDDTMELMGFESLETIGDPSEWPAFVDAVYLIDHKINLLKPDRLKAGETGDKPIEAIQPFLKQPFGTIVDITATLEKNGEDVVALVKKAGAREFASPLRIETPLSPEGMAALKTATELIAYESVYSTGAPAGWPGSEKGLFEIHHCIEVTSRSNPSE